MFAEALCQHLVCLFLRLDKDLTNIHTARSEDSSVEKREPVVPTEKREPSQSTIDGVNLNMAEGQVAELTFVETREVDEDDEE